MNDVVDVLDIKQCLGTQTIHCLLDVDDIGCCQSANGLQDRLCYLHIVRSGQRGYKVY